MSSSSSDPIQNWYLSPPSTRDIIAGALPIVLSFIFITTCTIVALVLWKASKEIVGFRYLFSSQVANILCMLQYGVINGIAILSRSRLVTGEGREWLQLHTDFVWFAFCFHLPIVAWSRLHAISSPHSFRKQSQFMSYAICGVCAWLLSLAICLATHWQSFYVLFYYEPAIYGIFAEDSVKYATGGHAYMFNGIHIFVIVLPLFFYTSGIILLIRSRRHIKGVAPTSKKSVKGQSVETKLILPCILGTIVFIIGQAFITFGIGRLSDIDGFGPWTAWTICLLLFINSALQPLLLTLFSPFIRKRIKSLFSARKKSTVHTVASHISTS